MANRTRALLTIYIPRFLGLLQHVEIHSEIMTGSGETGSGETHFTIVSSTAGGPVAFWLTLWMLVLAGIVFLCCIFCHSKEAKAGMTLMQACMAATKAACRGVLGLVLSGLLFCMSASGTSVNSEDTSSPRSQLGEPRFTRLVEEAAEVPPPPPRGRREEVEAEAPPPPPPPRGRREEVEAEAAPAAEKARGTIEAIEASVEAFRSGSIGGKEVIEYRVQARTILV